jgi:hypothetical protein
VPTLSVRYSEFSEAFRELHHLLPGKVVLVAKSYDSSFQPEFTKEGDHFWILEVGSEIDPMDHGTYTRLQWFQF